MSRPLRILLIVVLAALLVVVLFTTVFPWVDEQLNDPTLDSAPTLAVGRHA